MAENIGFKEMTPEEQAAHLKSLGAGATKYKYDGPDPSVLEVFPNKFPGRNYIIEHFTDEFTSLCPKTGQPDYATISIQYVADEKCVESKALKLYLMGYRNHGCFMETLINTILEDLALATQPRWMSVVGNFKSRGGIAISVVAEYGQKPTTSSI